MRWRTLGLAALLAGRLLAETPRCTVSMDAERERNERAAMALIAGALEKRSGVPYDALSELGFALELEQPLGNEKLCRFTVDYADACASYQGNTWTLNEFTMDIDGIARITIVEEANDLSLGSTGPLDQNTDIAKKLYKMRYGREDADINPETGEYRDMPAAHHLGIVAQIHGRRHVSYVRAPEIDGCFILLPGDTNGDGKGDVLAYMLDNTYRSDNGEPVIEEHGNERHAVLRANPVVKTYCGDGEGGFAEKNCFRLPPHLRIRHPPQYKR